MKKLNVILICVAIALISGSIGFLTGYNINSKSTLDKADESLVGTYKTSTWNGKEAVLVLNEDKMCIYPTGAKGIWSVEGNKLYIDIENNYSYMDGTVTNIESTSKQEAIIVDKGIMINSHFFEKIK